MRVGPPCRVWYHRPIFTLPTAPQVSRPEDLVTSQAGNRPLVEMRLHSWDGPLPFQTCRDPRHAQLHLQSLFTQGTATVMPNTFPGPIHVENKSIAAHNSPHHGTHQGRRKVSDPQYPGTVTPKLKSPSCPFCISPDSIRLIDKSAVLLRNPCHSCNMERGSPESFNNPFWRTFRDERRR